MSKAISGKPWSISWDVSGTITDSTAPTLFINGSSSGATVTWTTAVAGVVTASVSLAGVAVGALVQFRGGMVEVGAVEYDIASEVEPVERPTYRVEGVTVANPTPFGHAFKLETGHAAFFPAGSLINMDGIPRRVTGVALGVDEIAVDDTTGLDGPAGGAVYFGSWESGRLSGAGLTDIEIEMIGALSTYGASTHTAAHVWAVTTRQLTGTQTFDLTGNINGSVSGSVGSVTAPIALPSIPANWIKASGIEGGALADKGNWATEAELLALAMGPMDASIIAPKGIERPESGSIVVVALLRVYTDTGAPVNLGASPTFTLENAAGTDRSSMLGTVTNPSTGEYRTTITVTSSSTLEQVLLRANFTKDSVSRSIPHTLWIENVHAETWTLADRNQLNAVLLDATFSGVFHNERLAKIDGALQADDPVVEAVDLIALAVAGLDEKIGEPTGADLASDLNAVKGDTALLANGTYGLSAIKTLIDSVLTIFSGMTSLPNWLRNAWRSDSPDATALGEINAGGGTFNAAHTTQAIRVRGDAAWTGGGGGGGPEGAYVQTITVTRSDTSALIANARVRATDGITSWVATTNGSGVAVISLDSGTYTVTISANGASFTPTPLDVADDAAVSYAVTPIVISAPASPNMTNAQLSINRNLYPGQITFTLQMLAPPPGAAGYWDLTEFLVVVEDDEDELLIALHTDATYRIKRGSGGWKSFIPIGEVYAIPQVLGVT